MYLLVTEVDSDYGGSYEDTMTYDTFDELAEAAYKFYRSGDFLDAYEIKREVFWTEISQYRADRENARKRAIEVARAKLTVEELELLGIK